MQAIRREICYVLQIRVTVNIFKHWNFNHNIIFPIAFSEDIKICPYSFKQKHKLWISKNFS